MKYQNLKNMTAEEKETHKRKQKAKAQRKYYQTHKDYYKNYSTKWARQEKINMKNEIDRLNNDIKTLLKENEAKEKVIKKQDYIINELEEWLKEDFKKVYRDMGHRNNIINEVLDKLKELKENK